MTFSPNLGLSCCSGQVWSLTSRCSWGVTTPSSDAGTGPSTVITVAVIARSPVAVRYASNTISERVRMFAPSTVIAIGVPWYRRAR